MSDMCQCGLEVRPDIWLCPHHKYFKGTRQYASVSSVIKATHPTDYSRVSPIVLETARIRGSFVDQYFCDWVEGRALIPLADVPETLNPCFPHKDRSLRQRYAEDTAQRIELLLEWWDAHGCPNVKTQVILYSETDGVAGTCDIKCPHMIMDIKCTSGLYESFVYQLGSYSEYSRHEDVGILWVKKNKIELVPYDAKLCRKSWNMAVLEFNALHCD